MRLIDADALEYDILHQDVEVAEYNCKDYESYINGANQFRYQTKNAIRQSPTVDTKTEVAREIFAEIEKIIFLKHRFNENRAVVEMDFEELKKIRHKYTKEGE